MLRAVLLAAALLLGPETTAGHTSPIQRFSVECCKVCRKGKACGDTCIARDKDCHKPPGCACDG